MPYFLFYLHKSQPILFELEDFGNERCYYPVSPDAIFSNVDGNLTECRQLGLGCVLISKDILKEVKFRVDETDKKGSHADTYFNQDCIEKGVKIYCDTKVWVEHRNGSWSKVNKQFKTNDK
ncbi:MAG: hypothetical protein HC892_01415 [Saprospiraceae bacterium]|nr:hypothetical protein [Saprospiraceae bacterium]